MFNYMNHLTQLMKNNPEMTEKQFFEQEIKRWKASHTRKNQILGKLYYEGQHDILKRKRTVIGKDGKLQEVDNLPNNRTVDNQYAKMVDQKTNYLFGKQITYKTENEKYETALSKILDKRFHRILKNTAINSLNGAIGWLYPYYNSDGKLQFKRFEPDEILPFWHDAEHTKLDCGLRLFEVVDYQGTNPKILEKVEIYKLFGVERYNLINGFLIEDTDQPIESYIVVEESEGDTTKIKRYNWNKVPLIPFKYNDKEIPLICKTKSLQDGINTMLSDFQNNMQEDSRNTIMILKNYDGENLADFRHNLATYGAIKVTSIEGVDGGVEALQIEVNADNYRVILDILKKALIENAMGYDAKDEKMSGNPNQMNILSMYSDIDLDANGMETEYQASFEELLWFINVHLANTGQGDFEGEDIEIIFNRDMMMNETDIITNIQNSVGILSEETLVANHPWVNDVQIELDRLKAEKAKALDDYQDVFPNSKSKKSDGDNGDIE